MYKKSRRSGLEKGDSALSFDKTSILKPSNCQNTEDNIERDKITENEKHKDDQEQNCFSINDFTKNLNELCLKTPNQKKITKEEITNKTTRNKVTFDPPPGTFNITFDTSESESENEEINLVVVDAVKKTPPKQQPLEGVTVFVDVRAENENRSKAISRELERLGATIADKVSSQISHVVFKDGRQGTLTQLKKFPNIHFVSVLWVDACKTIGCRVNEGLYPARNPKEDVVGLPPARVKRVKSLQPKTFEEDVNNSAKKEDRRRKRLRKLDKDFNTPTDQIICLDSQEYIKSSDLHKLVATPLAIPDTPWILNYINGSDDEGNEVSPDQMCPQVNLNDSQDNLKELSQDVQCKLNFDATTPKRDSCLIDIGSSPSKMEQSKPTAHSDKHLNLDKKDIVGPTPKKVYFAKRTSICRKTAIIEEKTTPSNVTSIKKQEIPISSNRISNTLSKSNSRTPSKQKKPLNLQKSKSISLSSKPCPRTLSSQKTSTVLQEENFSSTPSKLSLLTEPKILISSKTSNSITIKSTSDQKNLLTSPQKEMTSLVTANSNTVKDAEEKFVDLKESPVQQKTTTNNLRLTSSPLKRKSPSKVSYLNKDDADSKVVNDNGKPQVIKKKKKLMSKSIFSMPQEKLISPALKNDTNKLKASKSNDELTKTKRQPLVTNRNERPNVHTMLQQLGQSKKENSDSLAMNETRVVKEDKPNMKEISNTYSSLLEDTIVKHLDTTSVNSSNQRSPQPVGVAQSEVKHSTIPDKSDEKPDQCEKDLPRRRSTRRSSIDFQIGKRFTKTKPIKDKCTEIQSEPIPEEFSLTNNEPMGLNVSFVHDENEGLVCTSQRNGTVYQVTEDEESDVELLEEDAISNREIDSGISDSEEVIHDEVDKSQKEVRETKERATCSTITSGRQSDTNRLNDTSLQSTSTSNGTVNKSNSIKKCKQSLVCTSLHFSEQNFAKGVVKKLKEFQLKKNIAPDTTHVIAGTGRRTLNILHAIVQGCWILSPRWLSDSLEANCWLNEEDYEMHEEFPAAKVSRLNRMRYGKSSCSRLFSKLPRIFLAEVTSPPHEEMMRLIVSCGGQLTNAIRKAGIAIGLVTCRRKDVKILSEKWILDSITNGHLMPTKSYEYLTRCLLRETSPDY